MIRNLKHRIGNWGILLLVILITTALYGAARLIIQPTLGEFKTAATLYQTDGQIVNATHSLYTQPGTGATWTVDIKTISPLLSDSVQHDSAFITPYAEVSKSYSDVKKIAIYNAAKNIRVGFGGEGTATGDEYWVIPSTAVGYERDGLDYSTLAVKLKGDTTSDTATVRIIVWK